MAQTAPTKALRNWKIFVNSYRNDYDETIITERRALAPTITLHIYKMVKKVPKITIRKSYSKHWVLE